MKGLPLLIALSLTLVLPSTANEEKVTSKDASKTTGVTKAKEQPKTTVKRVKRKRVTTSLKRKTPVAKPPKFDDRENISDESDFSNCR